MQGTVPQRRDQSPPRRGSAPVADLRAARRAAPAGAPASAPEVAANILLLSASSMSPAPIVAARRRPAPLAVLSQHHGVSTAPAAAPAAPMVAARRRPATKPAPRMSPQHGVSTALAAAAAALALSLLPAPVAAQPAVGNLTILLNTTAVLPLRVSGALMIDLWSVDYNAVTRLWDNRATAGAVSTGNGDFGVLTMGSVTNAPPAASSLVSGVRAVVFAPGQSQSLSTLSTPTSGTTSGSHFGRMFGTGPWTMESVIMPLNNADGSNAEVNNESPYFQWAARGSPACRGGFGSLGHHPIWGAGGHFDCDMPYLQSPSTVMVTTGATSGYRPIPGVWHHIAYTYSGAAADGGPGTMAVYVDGELAGQVYGRNVNPQQYNWLHLGSWFNGGTSPSSTISAACAIHMFRFHSGAFSAADAAFNWAQVKNGLLASVAASTSTDPFALDPTGYQTAALAIRGFGTNLVGVVVTYRGPSPFVAGESIVYPAGVDTARSNSTTLIITTAPGVGPNLVFTVTLGTARVNSSVIAGYAAPAITGVTGLTARTVSPLGGDSFAVTGSSFGPLSLPGYPAYTPTVTYGWPGANFTAVGCRRTVASTITCNTAPGAGAGWLPRVCVGVTGQCSSPAPFPVNYPPPNISTLYGALQMSTAGGERLVATGINLGTPATTGVYPVQLQWGPPDGSWPYNGSACVLERVSQSSSNMQVSCTTVPGRGGRGLVARIVIGSAVSNVLSGTGLTFAPPVVQSIAGPGAVESSTLGGQAVNISGFNFGNDASVLNVSYALKLAAANATSTGSTVVYTPASCDVTVPHTVLTCVTTAGVGAGLEWRVVVNGISNTQPTSSYAAPVISSYGLEDIYGNDLTAAGAASAGNTTVVIWGTGFGVAERSPGGAVPLLQAVYTVSPSGVRTLLPPSAYRIVSDAQVRARLPPGSGSGWSMAVRVADRDSTSSTGATFTYALPVVGGVDCGAAGGRPATAGGSTCTVTGSNFPLDDPYASIVVLFGNPSDGSLAPAALRASPVYRPDTDTSPTRYYPNMVTFTLPPGAGAARAVRLTSYRQGDAVPNPAAFAASPVPSVTTCAGGTPCGGADVVSYADPDLTLVVVARPTSSLQWDTANAAFGTDAAAQAAIRVLTLSGTNLGPGSFGNGGVVRDLEQLVGGTWVPLSLSWSPAATPGRPFVIDGTPASPSWLDSRVVVITNQTAATIRLAVTSLTWDGTPIKTVTRALTYVDLNPSVTVTQQGPYPTTGKTASGGAVVVPFDVSHLDAAGSLRVTVGGAACPLVAADGVTVVPEANYNTAIVNNPAMYTNAGSSSGSGSGSGGNSTNSTGGSGSGSGSSTGIGPDTVWHLGCVLPPGQGLAVPLIVTRLPDGKASASATDADAGLSAYSVIYSAPSVASVTVNGGAPVTVSPTAPRVVVSPEGTSVVTLTGTNFGTCPVVTFATTVVPYCGDGCSCTDAQIAAAAAGNVTRSSDHTTLSFLAPPGEGDGVVQTGTPAGWTLALTAGGQAARSDAIRVGWGGPRVTGLSAGGFPTRGGVTITVTGAGFGVSVTGAGLQPAPPVRVYVGTGPFADPESGGSTLPADSGTGANCTATGNATDGSGGNSTTTCGSGSGSSTPAVSGAGLWWQCAGAARVSQTAVTCSLPAGAGIGLYVVVVVSGQAGMSAGPLFSYDPPVVSALSSSYLPAGRSCWDPSAGVGGGGPGGGNSSSAIVGTPQTGVTDELRGPTTGGFYVTVDGANFGVDLRGRAGGSCVFTPWANRGAGAPALACDGNETFAGEGEVWSGYITSWTHDRVVFCMPQGSGVADVVVIAAGNAPVNASAGAAPRFAYYEPTLTSMNPGSGPAMGQTRITLRGSNFGPQPPSAPLRYPQPLPLLDRVAPLRGLRVDFGDVCVAWPANATLGRPALLPGAAACTRGRITSQSHNTIVLTSRSGVGTVNVSVTITDGGRIFDSNALNFTYNAPVISFLTPPNGTTAGGTPATIFGSDLTAFISSGQAVRVNWGPQRGDLASSNPGGLCVATWPPVNGTGQCVNGSVTLPSFGFNVGRSVSFLTPPGVGRDIAVSVSLIDEDGRAVTSNVLRNFSYKPPRITAFTPNPVLLVGGNMYVLAAGEEFGTDAVIAAWAAAGAVGLSTDVDFSIDGNAGLLCPGAPPARLQRADGTPTIQFCLNQSAIPVGYHSALVTTAGQTGVLPASDDDALFIGCGAGFYGAPGETCLPCPDGASCAGFRSDTLLIAVVGDDGTLPPPPPADTRIDTRRGGVHAYPRPLPGYFNLNSSDAHYPSGVLGSSAMADQCPSSAKIAGRDVCVVACIPADACVGDNWCADGYVSKAPLFRCAACAPGFFKRNAECIKCPSSPYALVIGFIVIVIAAGALGYVLNKRGINIAYLSIGVDYFQVLAMFANAKVSWPPAIKELFNILSAFNLNIEIVAPECLSANVTFTQKFAAVMLLPIILGMCFLVFHVGTVAWKFLVLGRRKKLTGHTAPLVSSLLLLMYMLYIYLCKTTLDVFNCQPSSNSDKPDLDANGAVIYYLQATGEPCGAAGGTQANLIPGAIAAFVLYVAGYPAFLAGLFYFRREIIVEDQLLRAKGTGESRLENPDGYRTRRMFSRVYYQFSPFWYWWTIVIVLRKFLIAFVSLMFARNAAFQLAACLFVLFVAFTAQAFVQPYMPPSAFDDVLRAHDAAALTSTLHARLRRKLAAVEARGRKRTRANIMTPTGKIDAKALLGVLMMGLFNYNTVEQVLLASAIVVCLLGILFASSGVAGNPYAAGTSDAIGGLVMAVVVLTILYFATVVITEIAIMWGEADRRRKLQRGRSGKGLKTAGGAASPGGGLSRPGSKSFKGGIAGGGPGGGGLPNIGVVTQEFNPIMMGGPGGGGGAGGVANGDAFTGDRQALVDAVTATEKPPPQELWTMLRATFLATLQHNEALAGQLEAALAGAGVCSVCGSSLAPHGGGAGGHKAAFGPVTAGGGSGGGEGGGHGSHGSSRALHVTPNPAAQLAAFRTPSHR